jgi:hypothetical protein
MMCLMFVHHALFIHAIYVLEQVLVRSAAYGVPLYVTETGVSIPSQRHRQFMVDSYVKEVRGR